MPQIRYLSMGVLVAAAVASVAAMPQEPKPGGATPEVILAAYGTFNTAEKRDALATLASRVAYGKAMMEGNTDAPKPSLKGLKSVDLNKTCLECHEKGNQANWAGGVHDRRGLSCTSCHGVHDYKSTQAQLKTGRDSETCFTCHAAIKAKTLRTSHHPVREGRLECASCHNPHDSTKPKMIKADWITDQCLTCHTEKRGPFLWEHAPVRENCALCHDPHGSNHDKMLVAKQPFLCQRCHLNTRHPGTLYDGTNTVGGLNVSNRAVEHACKNCHQNVHGGNAPSGPYFGR